MATQKYRSRLDTTVGENVAGPTRAVHPARPELPVKAGSENKTPAPLAPPSTTADQARSTSWGRSSGGAGDNPGKQGYGGPSSLNPGERAAPATINANAKTDAVLDNLIRGGVGHGIDRGDNWQTRDLTDPHDNPHKAAPIHSAMTGAAPGPKVPAKTGARADDSAARRNAQLKNGQ